MKIILINCDPVVRDFLSNTSSTATGELYVFSEADDLDRILRSSDFDLLVAEVQHFPRSGGLLSRRFDRPLILPWWCSLGEIPLMIFAQLKISGSSTI